MTGFLYLKESGKNTVEIVIMSVLKKYHKNWVLLFEKAKEVVANAGYSFMKVKTVKMGIYED